MTASAPAVPGSPRESDPAGRGERLRTHPLYWSLRRELWESRSVYLAPLFVAGLVMVGFVVSAIGLPGRRRAVLLLDRAAQQAAIEKPYVFAAAVLIAAAFVVGVFYCLDALHGERRDRSILFWKSLPVSDLDAVLAKAAVPLVVLPLVTFAVALTTQLLMTVWTSVLLAGSGMSPASTYANVHLARQALILLYALGVLTLWHAPIYAWLLLVSGWARRLTFLWAVLPFFAAFVVERLAFGSSYVAALVGYRLIGGVREAFVPDSAHAVIDSLAQLAPGRFLSTPGLWLGLVFAIAFLAAAVRLRRYREPL